MKFIKLRDNTRNKNYILLFGIICVFTLLLTVGYSIINEDLSISGEAYFRVEEDIRITNVELIGVENGGLESYESEFSKDRITFGADLKQANSVVRYKIEITNNGNVPMKMNYEKISWSNENIGFELQGYNPNYLIKSGEVKEYTGYFYYLNTETSLLNTEINGIFSFSFSLGKSVLSGGNNGASTSTFWHSPNEVTREKIESITFNPNLEVPSAALGSWDASNKQDGTAVAWYVDNDNDGLYELNVGGAELIYFSSNSSYLFQNFTSLETINFNNCVDTSEVTTMQYMFNNCSSLTNLDLSKFQSNELTNISSMFNRCTKLEAVVFGNDFTISKVTTMKDMFNSCSSLTNLDLSKFQSNELTNISSMFYKCTKLETVEFGDDFTTSKVTTMSDMFNNCSSLTNLDLSKFQSNELTNISRMFYWNPKLETIEFGDDFTTSKVTTMKEMFYGCSSLTNLDLSKFQSNELTDISSMFNRCTKLEAVVFGNDFTISKVTTMKDMFNSCSSLTNLDLSKFQSNELTDISNIFYKCTKLETVDIRKFDFSKVTESSNAFNPTITQSITVYVNNASKDFVEGLNNRLNIEVVSL